MKLRMRIVLASVLWMAPGTARAASPVVPTATLTVGFGNTMGGFGLQGEYYLAKGRVSAFAGIGYMPHISEEPVPARVAGAVGARLFTGGLVHRGFVEVSVAELGTEWISANGELVDYSRLYGPGIQVGYQHVARGGFTFMISAGVGYAPGSHGASTAWMGGIGIGHTWR